jgi:D-alanyl-D-alanine carboxypeptidase
MTRTRPLLVAGLLVALTAIIAALAYELPKASFSGASALSNLHRGERRGALGEADGAVPEGVTVFDDTVPAVIRLDPGLLKALRRAATAAADGGVEFHVNSGWRSPAYQTQLLREAVARYGSEDEAARWVATAATSPHVTGDAVDIGHADATAWLSARGAAYGLCQIYKNEPWHYELRAHATGRGCPHLYAVPTQDPRMQQ